MKILLDEDLPHKLRAHLVGHKTSTVAYMGWCGLKNGELLAAAEQAGFDVLVTGDQSMPNEQNLSGRSLAIVTLSAIEWPIIKKHVDRIAIAIGRATPGLSTRVECGRFQKPRNFGDAKPRNR